MIMNRTRSPEPNPSRKVTILIVGPTPPPYMGPSVATKMILESELQGKFHLLHLDTSDRRSLANLGKVDVGNVALALSHSLKLVAFLIRYSPRIVYIPICQSIRGYLRDALFIILAKLFGARVIIHLRGGYFRKLYEKSNVCARYIIRNTMRLVSRAIVLGESLRYIFEGLIPSAHIKVVPNGIDANYIKQEELQSKKRKASAKFRILFLSNLILTKGFFDVIKAVPLVVKTHSNVEFLLVGEFFEPASIRNEIFDYIHAHDLNPYIAFNGTAQDTKKKDLLLDADVFVLPTYYPYEGQPWVIIEAMAAGLPIITTDWGTIKDMVHEGENGFIIEKERPQQIADKIVQLLEDDALRQTMGEQSRIRFLSYFTRSHFIRRLHEVFDEVISENTAP